MNFQITHKIQSNEDSRWNTLNDSILFLEKHLRKIHPLDLTPSRTHKTTFWLMDALIKYNSRRSKLLNNFTHTNLSEEDYIEFDADLMEMEKIIMSYIKDKDFGESSLHGLKSYFWLMDGFVRSKLRHCKSYAVKNGIDCNISDVDLERSDIDNPLFNEPVTFKINRQTLTKLFGSKISKQVKAELMREINESANSLEAAQSMIESNAKDIDIGDANLNLLRRVANRDEIMIEHKSYNPLNREIKSVNLFSERNPLVNYNCFTKNNHMLKLQTNKELEVEKKREERKDMVRIRIEKPYVAKEIDKINKEKRREKTEKEKWKKDLIQNDLERRKVEEKQERIENLYGVYLENLILDYRKKHSTKIIKMSQKEKDKKTEELKVQARSEAEKEMERIEKVGRS